MTPSQAIPARYISSSPEIVLRTAADIDAFIRRSRSLFDTRRAGRAMLRVAELSALESLAIESRLNALARECGCQTGALAASLSFVIYAGLLFATAGAFPHWRLRHLFWGALSCLLSALLGKLSGILRARLRLVQELEELKARLNPADGKAAGGL